MTSRTLLQGAALVFGLACVAPVAQAQQIRLTISGLPLTKVNTPPQDFLDSAAVYGTMSFEVDVRSNGPQKSTTVSVRCATPCPATGALVLSRVEWQLDGAGAWTPLTTAYVPVATRLAQRNVLNDPWTGNITWRYRLGWEDSPPSPTSRFNLQFQLTVAAP